MITPAHRFVAEFIGVANFLPATVAGAAEADSAIQLAGVEGLSTLRAAMPRVRWKSCCAPKS